MVHLRLLLRDGRGEIAHQWGFFPDTAPSAGDYVYPQMVDVANGNLHQIRCLVRGRTYWPKFYCSEPDHCDTGPLDEYHCDITTEEPIGETWFAESELWNAQELYLAKRLKESGQ